MVSISIVLPVYRGAAYLKDAIKSILNQTFTDFELIIVNDASPDDSEEVIRLFTDARIKYIKNPVNLGLVGALNVGLDHCAGKYVARMDQDDISFPNRLKQQFEFMESHSDVIVCGMQIRILGTNTIQYYPLTDEGIRVALLFGAPFAHPVVMMRRAVLDNNNLRYEEFFKHAEDYGFWVKLSKYGKLVNLPEVGLDYRLHQQQYTKVFLEENKKSDINIREAYLRANNVKLNDEELSLYHKVANRDINVEDKNEMEKLSSFLVSFVQHFEGTAVMTSLLKVNLFNKWKKWCKDRQRKGLASLRLFISSPVSRWQTDIKTIIWLLQYQLFRK